MEKCEKRVNEEMQTARMAELRKSLSHIKETEWQYEPIEKLIGQAWRCKQTYHNHNDKILNVYLKLAIYMG